MRRTPKSLSQTERLPFIRLFLHRHSHSRTEWRQPFTMEIELWVKRRAHSPNEKQHTAPPKGRENTLHLPYIHPLFK